MAYRFLTQRRYLKLISSIPGMNDLNEHQIAREFGMSIAHLSRIFSEWAGKGYITKQDKDGRAINIRLTEEGKEWLEIAKRVEKLDNLKKPIKEKPTTKPKKESK